MATMALFSRGGLKWKSTKPPQRILLLMITILIPCFFQLHVPFLAQKRVVFMSSVGNPTHDAPDPTLDASSTMITVPLSKNATKNGMSACLLVMDDTIKLSEWLAYHYTVLPLTHLIVAIDPASSKQDDIERVLSLWNNRLEYLDVWTHDTWMVLDEEKGWPPVAYTPHGKLLKERIKRNPHLAHKRRQEHFSIQCMRKLKNIHPSWVLNMDTDEFLVYNYPGANEDASKFLKYSKKYKKEVNYQRNRSKSVRERLPPLDQVTIADWLTNETMRVCIKVPGLQMSARESTVSQVIREVPAPLDGRTFMTLRHRKYGRKHGHFTKCLIDLTRVPLEAIRQGNVRTIHNPLARICGRHAGSFIGIDYISSLFRLHHYAGTAESFGERLQDSRKGRNESFVSRNVEPVGETDDVRPWIAAFVRRVGIQEAQQLLQPLHSAYFNTDWNAVWKANDNSTVV